MFATEVRRRAADDGSYLLPVGRIVKIEGLEGRNSGIRSDLAPEFLLPVAWNWQEWRDSNPQPPVLETGALAS